MWIVVLDMIIKQVNNSQHVQTCDEAKTQVN
jgi:hypothetical protein